MQSLEEQARQQVKDMRKQAREMLQLAEDIEEAVDAGEQDYITDGDELVGFAFPQSESE